MAYLYACLFSNGSIKVGRTTSPDDRLAQHADRVSVLGVRIRQRFVAACMGDVAMAEAALIEQCAAEASRRFKREWFLGLDFSRVELWTREAASYGYQRPQRVVAFVPSDDDTDCRYICTWENGRHRWTDHQPHKFPCPDSAVMRWDLRPDDWHRVWPELLDHPCAVLYAPKYPGRTIELIKAAVPMFEVAPDLRPDDFARIWPELADPAPAQQEAA